MVNNQLRVIAILVIILLFVHLFLDIWWLNNQINSYTVNINHVNSQDYEEYVFQVKNDSISSTPRDMDQISRVNVYGDAPKCVRDQFPHLRPYCYCRRHSK